MAIEQSRNLRVLGHEVLLVTGFNIPYQRKFFGDQGFGYSKFKVPLPRSALSYEPWLKIFCKHGFSCRYQCAR